LRKVSVTYIKRLFAYYSLIKTLYKNVGELETRVKLFSVYNIYL